MLKSPTMIMEKFIYALNFLIYFYLNYFACIFNKFYFNSVLNVQYIKFHCYWILFDLYLFFYVSFNISFYIESHTF